jgi:hypothetical protein
LNSKVETHTSIYKNKNKHKPRKFLFFLDPCIVRQIDKFTAPHAAQQSKSTVEHSTQGTSETFFCSSSLNKSGGYYVAVIDQSMFKWSQALCVPAEKCLQYHTVRARVGVSGTTRLGWAAALDN